MADGVFVDGEVVVPAGFEVACESLARLARDGWLSGVSGEAHADWSRRLARIGPAGPVPGLSRLVAVRSRDLAVRGDVAVMVLRWEAAGPGGELFPVLDADIILSRYGQSQTLLALTGAYRPPLGSLGAALDRVVLRRVATATIRRFVTRLGQALADSVGAAVREQADGRGGAREAASGRVPVSPGRDAADTARHR